MWVDKVNPESLSVVFIVREGPRLQRPVCQSADAGESLRLQREEEKEQHALLQVSPRWVSSHSVSSSVPPLVVQPYMHIYTVFLLCNSRNIVL